ncbi:MAG: glycine/betaine ABC transporter substrate-binding protein [Thiomonas sp. 13-66-29]|nr:MAG: glycine/betaine ABC transporter substrate-binding protein [Thiomonas sp. 13-66-29]
MHNKSTPTCRTRIGSLLAGLGLLAAACGVTALAADTGWGGKARPPQYKESIFPPWQHGANNPALDKGLEFTVPEINDLPDFHGDPMTSKLNIFVGGNYFFAMAPLVAAFEKEHPELKGHIFYETLPPGILLKQMAHGGTITIGNMTMTVKPDVYAAGLKKVKAAIASGELEAPAIAYVTNDLTIMVPKGNPAHIKSLTDLGKPGVKLSMPNPAWEGVARQIEASLVKAGGKKLEQTVYDTKVKDGQTILTHIHHRQTPLFLMQGLADAGVTWKSEAIFQEQAGHPISHVDIPAADNTTAIYGVAVVKGAAHAQAGKEWAEFLRTPASVAIFEKYGFKPYMDKAS